MKTSFTTRVFRIASTLAALTASLTSHADAPRHNSMDACIQAFIASALPEGQPVRIEKREGIMSIDRYGLTESIVVTAKASRTGKEIARASCTVNSSGEVVELSGTRTLRVADASSVSVKSSSAR